MEKAEGKIMNSTVKIEPEIVRLAQYRSKAQSLRLSEELARQIAQEAIVNQDENLEFCVEEDKSFNANDNLAKVLGVNDIVVNDIHIDVRAINPDGTISINRALVGTSYLNCGSLAVKMSNPFSGEVVGYVSADTWAAKEETAPLDQGDINAAPTPNGERPLSVVLGEIIRHTHQGKDKVKGPAIGEAEIAAFVNDQNSMIPALQRQVVEHLLEQPEKLDNVTVAKNKFGSETIARILAAQAVWQHRIETVINQVSDRFPRLKAEDIRQIIETTGEKLGGQTQSPAFAKSMLSDLAKEELKRCFGGKEIAKIGSLIDQVFSGGSDNSIQNMVKSKLCLDIAQSIKNSRDKTKRFFEASAEELGLAMNELALSPSYATHSQDDEAGLEAINEALLLLEAEDLAQELKELEDELTA